MGANNLCTLHYKLHKHFAKMIDIETICNYIKQNFGDYNKKNLYWYNDIDLVCTQIKTQTITFKICLEMNECYLEFENIPQNNKMANDFVTWYIANIAKSAKHQTSNGTSKKNANVSWIKISIIDDTPNDDDKINTIMNAINANNEYKSTIGYLGYMGNDTMYKTLVNKKYDFQIMFWDLHHVGFTHLNMAIDIDNAHEFVKPIINAIMLTANFKSYEYMIDVKMFSFDLNVSFSE